MVGVGKTLTRVVSDDESFFWSGLGVAKAPRIASRRGAGGQARGSRPLRKWHGEKGMAAEPGTAENRNKTPDIVRRRK